MGVPPYAFHQQPLSPIKGGNSISSLPRKTPQMRGRDLPTAEGRSWIILLISSHNTEEMRSSARPGGKTLATTGTNP